MYLLSLFCQQNSLQYFKYLSPGRPQRYTNNTYLHIQMNTAKQLNQPNLNSSRQDIESQQTQVQTETTNLSAHLYADSTRDQDVKLQPI